MPRLTLLICIALELTASALWGQTLRGTALDSVSREPVSGAEVRLTGSAARLSARSDEFGNFQFANLAPGVYHIFIARLGYAQLARDIRLAGTDTAVTFALHRVAQRLPLVSVRDSATGIMGVVGTAEGLHPIAGAQIRLLGSRHSAESDSSGHFVAEIDSPGTFIVRITAPGYAEALFSTEVPPYRMVDASRLLDSPTASRGTGRDFVWDELDERIEWRGLNSAIVPASQLQQYGGSLIDALQGSPAVALKGLRISRSACLYINGIKHAGWSLNAIRPEEVVAVEVYGSRGDPTGSLMGCDPPGGRPSGRLLPETAGIISVWVKR